MKESWPLRAFLVGLFLFFLFSHLHLFGQGEEKTVSLPFPFTYFQLKNGLTVILAEDDSLPVVSIVVGYGVGAVHEKPGQAGLAYLIENLMFQGSLNVGPLQHFSYISRVGGRPNAQTGQALTLFFETVPAHQLPLVLWLESDRMMSLVISEEHLESARTAILGQLARLRFQESFLDSFLLFKQMVYPDFARNHPVSGYEDDIQKLSAEEVREFYHTYYVPNNAVLCVVGHFNRRRAKELIEKYFETIPRGKEISWSSPPPFELKGPLIRSYVDPLASSPAAHLAYRVASPQSAEYPVFQVIDYILNKGKSSWLQKRLLRREKIAVRLEGWLENNQGVAYLRFFVVANNDIMVERCLRAIEAEISRLKSSLVSPEELSLTKNKYLASLRKRQTTSLERAIMLAEAYFTQPSLEETAFILEKPLKVEASDIVGLANRYFIPENLAVLQVKIR